MSYRTSFLCRLLLPLSGDEADLRDGKELRRLALQLSIPTVTTVAGAKATAAALRAMRAGPLVQIPLQVGQGWMCA